MQEKNGLSGETIKNLYKLKGEYYRLKKPFKRDKYVGVVSIIVNGKRVSPTDDDVDKCIRYLEANNRLVCQKTVYETVRKYIAGEIDLPEEVIDPELSPEEALEVSDLSEEFEGQLKRDIEDDRDKGGDSDVPKIP